MYTLCTGRDNSHYNSNVEVFELYRDALKAFDESIYPVKVIFKLNHTSKGEFVGRECKKFKSAPGSCNKSLLRHLSGLQ